LINLDDTALYTLAYGRSGTLWQSLKSNADYQDARDYLADVLARADYAPPFEFFSHILAVLGGRRAILRRLGPEATDPIDEFLNLALDFERSHTPSLQGFLHWLQAGDTVIKRDLEIDRQEVRVLTVHGSKGLQANIVFLPDTCSEPDKGKEDRILWSQRAPLWQPVKRDSPEICKNLRDKNRKRTEQEYRRLLYVAMTRSCDRLYVCGYETTRGRSENCWYNLVDQAFDLVQAEDVPIAGFEPTGRRISTEQTAETEDKQAGQGHTLIAAPPPDWAHLAPPPEPDPAQPLTPSRPTEDEPTVRSPLAGDDDGERFKRGTLIHRLLESLPLVPPENRLIATQAFLARPVHGLSSGHQAEIANETLAVLDDPGFAPLFGPDSQAEVSISGRIGQRIVSARIDRLLIAEKTVTIVDYKTNRPAPMDVAQVSPAYLIQMAVYRALLAQIYPDHAIDCVLAWTDGPRLMALPGDMLDNHLPAPP
ncbi:MAG TPA: double-strand break repair helicase AddA, partial [Rhodospirillales bacterium]|nr:double-strand break repair helicase AddA [Rhodospirillales bacterium]